MGPYPNKVIGLGLSRTGTTALFNHCEALGLPAHHYPVGLYAHQESIFGPDFPSPVSSQFLFRQRLAREIEQHHIEHATRILHGDTCLFDSPVPLYFERIFDLHPSSLYVYTYRSMDGWLDSMKWLFKEGRYLWRLNDLDISLLKRTYGCTRFDRDTLVDSRLRYEDRLFDFFSNRTARFRTIDIDKTEISLDLIRNLLGLGNSDALTKEISRRHNERRSAPVLQKIDYSLSRAIPGYGPMVKALRRSDSF